MPFILVWCLLLNLSKAALLKVRGLNGSAMWHKFQLLSSLRCEEKHSNLWINQGSILEKERNREGGRERERKKLQYLSLHHSLNTVASLHPLMPETSIFKSNQWILKNGIWGLLAGVQFVGPTPVPAGNKISCAECSRERTDLRRGFDPIHLKALL